MIQYESDNFIVFQSQIYKTTSVVVKTDDCVLVVDPNLLPNEISEIRHYVDQIAGDFPIYLIFTHSDWDHIVGYGAFPEATVIASNEFDLRQDKENILQQLASFDEQYYIDRTYRVTYPKVDITVKEDGQKFNIGNTNLTFYKAAGHTDDGIFVLIEPIGIWIAGDYFSNIEFPFMYDSSLEYERTILKTDPILDKHHVHYLVPGHGAIATSKTEILKRKEDSLHYIRQLRNAILTNTKSEHLLKNYCYKSELEISHQGNIELLKKELETRKT